MHFLVGLGIASVIIFYWIGGNPIARIFVFLLLACIGALCTAGSVAILAAPVIAWFVAGIPAYYYRRQHLLPPHRWPNP